MHHNWQYFVLHCSLRYLATSTLLATENKTVKKIIVIIIVLLLLAAALAFVLREPLKQAAYDRLTADMFVSADTDAFDPGPAIGSSFPGLRAIYQGREVNLLGEFAGSRGTVLIASRSLDWCPYCMKQMIELQQYKQAYDDAGIGMVAITYDAPQLQQAFIDKFSIGIPVLSDIDALSFKTLGILNTQYQAGDRQYGIPYPGMIVINRQGIVVGKLFLEAYSSRVSATAALEYTLQALGEEA